MDKKYTCYCGLYCENCAVKAKVEPAAVLLHKEMKKAGFEDIIHMIPDGNEFWRFLKSMSEDGPCISCREGSGNPCCTIRICAREKGVEMCALCESYPCEHFAELLKTHPMLKDDNALLRNHGMDKWDAMQDERRAAGFTYCDGQCEP